jgi:RNase P subunit RPR2
MESKAVICQSCGMHMRKDDDFGTNVDGTKSGEYCCFCFKDGGFTDEGITMEQKIDKLVELAVSQMQIPEEKARAMAEEMLPRLGRWRQA